MVPPPINWVLIGGSSLISTIPPLMGELGSVGTLITVVTLLVTSVNVAVVAVVVTFSVPTKLAKLARSK